MKNTICSLAINISAFLLTLEGGFSLIRIVFVFLTRRQFYLDTRVLLIALGVYLYLRRPYAQHIALAYVGIALVGEVTNQILLAKSLPDMPDAVFRFGPLLPSVPLESVMLVLLVFICLRLLQFLLLLLPAFARQDVPAPAGV